MASKAVAVAALYFASVFVAGLGSEAWSGKGMPRVSTASFGLTVDLLSGSKEGCNESKEGIL